MSRKVDILETIDTALDQYNPTVELLQKWLSEKTNMDEFLILACARLDSLSNLAFPQGTQKEKFVKFLQTYSHFKESFLNVSVPDLYFFISYHLWALPGTIEKPGRLHMFNPNQDRQFIGFLWNSNIGLSQTDIERLLKFLIGQLKRNYRVVPNQTLRKPTSDSLDAVQSAIQSAAKRQRRGTYMDAADSARPLLEGFTLGSLLYQEYRCGAIHQYHVKMDETNFFKRNEPYWCPFHNELLEVGSFLRLHFPGPFLLDTLIDGIKNYKTHLKTMRKLPADLFFEFCDVLADMHYLNDDSIPSGRDVKLSY
jgi:hypothetical protein